MHGATQKSWPRWCVAASCRNKLALCGWSEAAAEGAAAAAVRPEDHRMARTLPDFFHPMPGPPPPSAWTLPICAWFHLC